MRTRIKELCREKGMTISAIAEQIGTTQTSLSRALGDNGNPTLETLDKIANALNVHITELFEQPQNNEAGITCPHCGKSITIKVE
ncbi:helix-turn-helix transcriptional regulator [Bacteroides fragilis]|uniref:helix-turn-helix domain-containing protein n=1 Tax=Bacteroides fragilis TaxID=817 RepID=UPI0020300859|nr:helix-turn-helix transcriptional regulator [Bacteroides fragilis]MCM0343918.1 helix-turn-helix transcriptional regulator [Bacteroides fragilis]